MRCESSSSLRRIAPYTALFAVIVLFLLFGVCPDHVCMNGPPVEKTTRFSVKHRRLLNDAPSSKLENYRGKGKENDSMAEPDRIWGERCSNSDILISQGPTEPLPSGIPTYTAEIMNVCLSAGCDISNIHLSCGWFSSARLINPRIFKRIGFDDCLVNDGKPLLSGRTLSFQYANTFSYPLAVSSVTC